MKRCILLLLVAAGCNAAVPKKVTPTIDDYRGACAVIDSNLALLRSDLKKLRDLDISSPRRVHSDLWWASELGLADDTATVISVMHSKDGK